MVALVCGVLSACGGSSGTDAGTRVDSGSTTGDVDSGQPVVDAGAVDAGCLLLETADGGCIPLLFSNVCSVPKLTVVHTGDSYDDNAGTAMAASLAAHCTPPQTVRTLNWRDAGILDSTGAPLVARDDVLLCGGGSFNQPHIEWLENTGVTQVYDSSTPTVASMTRRGGAMIFAEPVANLNQSLDFFVLQLARGRPGGPVTISGYGMYAPGTTAAAYYFEHNVLPALSTHSENFYVVKWTDLDADALPSQAAEFTVLASGH